MSGKAEPRYAPFDQVVKDAMQQYETSAALLAIRVNGKLVYERGFGWLDEAKTKPTPSDGMCRIASLTKPVTAAAVRMLIKQQKIKPTTKVFEYLKLEPFDGATVDPRLKDVTIEHLILHQGGWDRDMTFDPTWKPWDLAKEMKLDRPPTPTETVRYMMGQPLQFSPGERRGYSNLGYMLLGMVVEKAGGEPYYDFCEKRIFTSRGMIKDVRRAKARLGECDPREVFYIDDRKVRSAIDPGSKDLVPNTYGGFVPEYRDSVGGWVMTAAAYARFMDDFQTDGEPLKRGKRYSHGGSQPGVDAHAIWRSDGMRIVMLMNRDIEAGGLDDKLNATADAIAAPKQPAGDKTR